jgi:hypothetical protein
MADIPTLSALQTQIEADLKAELGITKNWIGKVFLRVLAIVQASKLKLFYLAIGLLQKNIFVDTCDEATLLRFGRVKLNRDPFPATSGEYVLNITGNIGGIVAKGQTFKSSGGYVFETKAAVELTTTTGQIEVVA